MNRKEQLNEDLASQDVGNFVTYAFGQGDWMTEINELCSDIASIHNDIAMKNPIDQNRVALVSAKLAGVQVSMRVDQEYQSAKDAAFQTISQSVMQLRKDVNAYINPPQKKLSRRELRAVKKAAEAENKKVDRLSAKVDVATEQAAELGEKGPEISEGLKETNKGIKSIGLVLKEFVTETIPNLIEISRRKAEVRKDSKADKGLGWTRTKVDKASAKENDGPLPEDPKPGMK